MIGGSRTLGRRGKPPAPDGSPSRHRGRTDGLRPPPRRVENGKIVSSPCVPGHGKIPSYPRRKYSPSDPGHGKISFRVFPGLSKILLRARRGFPLSFFSLACTCVRPLSADPRDSNVSTVTDYVARVPRRVLQGAPAPSSGSPAAPRWGRPPGTSRSSPVLLASVPTLFLE